MVKIGSISLSTDWRIIRYSNALTELLGFTYAELSGREFSSLSPEGFRDAHGALLERARSGPVVSHKTMLTRKGGPPAEVYLSLFPMRDRSGSVYSYMAVISSEKPGEVPGILSEEFQRMFRFSNDSVAVTDRDGNIIDVNASFLSTYGYTREEVLGKNPRILRSTHSTPELYERMWADILDPEKGYWRGEIINLKRDGTEVPVLLSINAIKDANGEIRNFLGIAFDISGQKELERINRIYIDYIIHDLRSPLTVIMANAELLSMQLEGMPEKMTKKVRRIRECAEKINRMASDILEFSRARQGSMQIKRVPASLAAILREALQPFECNEKRLTLNGTPYKAGEVEEKFVSVDADKLQRILYNLLSNAFKYASSEVRLDFRVSSGELAIHVYNDGKAIPAIDAERIFDAFYQTDEGIRTGGAGLGLSIVKTFTEAHGGTISAVPGAEKGMTFVVSIPLP